MSERQIAGAPGDAPQDVVAILRERHLDRRDPARRTHYVGCMHSHPLCALAWALDEIERQRAELAQARETIIDSEARNMAYAWWEARRG